MRPLKVGIQLPEVEREVSWPEVQHMAQLAESLGYDSLWVGDHLLYRNPGEQSKGPWEAWSMLAALAVTTQRMQLGPLVAATSFHNPALLAKKAATVDEISDGRLILGLGAGWNETEYRAFGFPFDNRVSRFEEAFTIIRTLLREGEIDFDGRYYRARDCELRPRPRTVGGPPLMIGSNGRRMLRIAIPYVDYWNSWHDSFGNSAQRLGPLMAEVDDACRDTGRDPQAVGRTVTVLVRLSGGVGRNQGDSKGRDTPPLSGSSEELAQELRAYASAGVSHVQLVLDPISASSIEEFAPALALLDAD